MDIRRVQPLHDYGEQRHAFPTEIFFGDRPPMPVLPFYKSAYYRVPLRSKMGSQARPCFILNFGYNHGSDCFKIMDPETGRVVHSRGVTWHQPRKQIISPAPKVDSAVPYLSFGAEQPGYVYIQPTPVATATPATAPAPAPAAVAPVPASVVAAPAPAPPSNPPAPIPGRVIRELGHEADVCMPGRRRGETHAMRDSHNRMGLMSHAALAQQLATREAFDKAFREHDLLKAVDLPTAPASDIPTPSTVAEAEASEQAEIWRGFRAREFSGLLQAHTFGPA